MTNRPVTLVEQAQRAIRKVVKPGDTVIDATAGNGHDTVFLAELVGVEGRVIAVDVQGSAIETTRRRLEERALHHVELLHQSHALPLPVPPASVAAVMFNLGYQPGSDKSIVTRSETTTIAIDKALKLLKPGGVMTIVCYRGHAGGDDEDHSIQGLLTRMSTAEYGYRRIESDPANQQSPVLTMITRQGQRFAESTHTEDDAP